MHNYFSPNFQALFWDNLVHLNLLTSSKFRLQHIELITRPVHRKIFHAQVLKLFWQLWILHSFFSEHIPAFLVATGERKKSLYKAFQYRTRILSILLWMKPDAPPIWSLRVYRKRFIP